MKKIKLLTYIDCLNVKGEIVDAYTLQEVDEMHGHIWIKSDCDLYVKCYNYSENNKRYTCIDKGDFEYIDKKDENKGEDNMRYSLKGLVQKSFDESLNGGRTRGFEVVSDEHRKHPNTDIKLPKRASKHSGGYDIYSPIDIIIKPMESFMIWTDVKAYFKQDEELLINVRSSMGKQPIMLANTQGWVESDYHNNEDNDGNLGLNLFNLGKTDYVIKKGDRIGQCMFVKFYESDNGNTEEERKGGFGSSGK